MPTDRPPKTHAEVLSQAAERYEAMMRLASPEVMMHPQYLPYTHIEVSTGAAVLCMDAWNNDAHRLAREYIRIRQRVSWYQRLKNLLRG